jgi:dihydroorotase-like cyclic amidohydrolase
MIHKYRRDITIENYEHFYVSPGIIDLNVKFNGEWEGRISGTMQAISGGVTLVMEQ